MIFSYPIICFLRISYKILPLNTMQLMEKCDHRVRHVFFTYIRISLSLAFFSMTITNTLSTYRDVLDGVKILKYTNKTGI